MEYIKGYDAWKTTPPDDPEPKYHCEVCGEPIYEGELFYDIGGDLMCQECIGSHRRLA